ncbi:hypothetical protein CR513_08918, partial [Mucuna pruriens]
MTLVPYASGVGNIMYGMVCSRPNLAYAINVVSRFMANPGPAHWGALKWILRFKRKLHDEETIKVYVDFDYARNINTRKSLFGYVFTYLSVVALSTTQVEFIALKEGVKEVMRIKCFIGELGIAQNNVTKFVDSQNIIHPSKHQVYHEKSKHIDVKLHFIQDVIQTKEILVENVATKVNPTNVFTKSLPLFKFKDCLNLISFGRVPTTVTNEASYGRVVQYLLLWCPTYNSAFTSMEFIRVCIVYLVIITWTYNPKKRLVKEIKSKS